VRSSLSFVVWLYLRPLPNYRYRFDEVGLDDELCLLLAAVGELLGLEGDMDRFGFVELEGDALEASSSSPGAFDFGLEVLDVRLNDLIAGARSGVRDVYVHSDVTALGEARGARLEIREFRGGVA